MQEERQMESQLPYTLTSTADSLHRIRFEGCFLSPVNEDMAPLAVKNTLKYFNRSKLID
jgi:hypothetical protein